MVTSVFKELGTIVPDISRENKTSFDKIESCEQGTEFDKLYIKSQIENHKLLRNLTEDYLKEAPAEKTDREESQGKYLATLVLTVFNEHITLTERINDELLIGGEDE